MAWTGRRKLTPIGLDIGSRAVKAVQLARTRGGWEIAAATIQRRAGVFAAAEGIGDVVEQLRMLLLRGGFAGDELVVAVPSAQLEVDILELPPRSSSAPLAQIARAEMARATKLGDTPFEMAFWELPAAARGGSAVAGATALAVAVRGAAANTLLDPLEAHGFNVRALDTQSWALARACAAIGATTPAAITAVLDLGWSSAQMTLLHENIVIYQRRLERGGVGPIVRTVGEEFELSNEEAELVVSRVGLAEVSESGDEAARAGTGASEGKSAAALSDTQQSRRLTRLAARCIDTDVVAEIEAALNYASHRYRQQPVERIWVVGAGSGVPGLCAHLTRRLNVTAAVLNPLAVAKCEAADLTRLCGDGLLTVAAGLAMHERE